MSPSPSATALLGIFVRAGIVLVTTSACSDGVEQCLPVVVSSAADLADLEGVPEFECGLSIADSLDIVDLAPLAALRRVGALTVSNNSALETLNGLEGLNELTYSVLTVSCNPALTSLSSLANIINPGREWVSIVENEMLASLDGLQWVEDAEVELRSLPILSSLTGLGNADGAIGMQLRLTDLPSMTNIVSEDDGRAGWSYFINDLPALTSIDFTAGGAVYEIRDAPLLGFVGPLMTTNFDYHPLVIERTGISAIAFPEAIRCGESLTLRDNPNLTSFSMPKMTQCWALEVTDSPLLPRCQVDAFLAQLEEQPERVLIEGLDDSASCDGI